MLTLGRTSDFEFKTRGADMLMKSRALQMRRPPKVSTGKAVLVLDDDPSMLKGVERLLNAHGFESKLFDSVENFCRGAQLHEALCLVLDINLDGKSGIELSRELVTSGISLPVIFITGNDSDTTRRAAMEAGCVAYLTKPFPAKSLIGAIEKVSAERTARNDRT